MSIAVKVEPMAFLARERESATLGNMQIVAKLRLKEQLHNHNVVGC